MWKAVGFYIYEFIIPSYVCHSVPKCHHSYMCCHYRTYPLDPNPCQDGTTSRIGTCLCAACVQDMNVSKGPRMMPVAGSQLTMTWQYLTCVLPITSKALFPMHCILRHAEDTRPNKIAVPYAHPTHANHCKCMHTRSCLANITDHHSSLVSRSFLEPTFEISGGPFQGCPQQMSKTGMVILRTTGNIWNLEIPTCIRAFGRCDGFTIFTIDKDGLCPNGHLGH